jgi:cytochrome c5
MLGAVALCAGTVVVSADDAKPQTTQQRLAKGKDLIDSICFWCHEPELMKTKALDKEEWSDLIRPMVYEGAPVTDDEFARIVEYLAKTLGPVNEDQ